MESCGNSKLLPISHLSRGRGYRAGLTTPAPTIRYDEFGDAMMNAGSQNANGYQKWSTAEFPSYIQSSIASSLRIMITIFRNESTLLWGSLSLVAAAGLKPRACDALRIVPRLVCIIAVLGKGVHFLARDSLFSADKPHNGWSRRYASSSICERKPIEDVLSKCRHIEIAQ